MRNIKPGPWSIAIIVVSMAVAATAFAAMDSERSSAVRIRKEHVEQRDSVDTTSSDAPPDPKRERLAAYTLEVMNDWPPALIPAVDYGSLADDIAHAALARASASPEEDAVLLASLAYWEGARFARYVDLQWCNVKDWRQFGVDEGEHVVHSKMFGTTRMRYWTSQELMLVGGDCDGGRAHTLWQIWPTIDRSAPRYTFCSAKAIEDRVTAARCALEIAAADPSLCGYTGEKPHLGCEKAEVRVEFARKAMRKHPFSW